MNKDLQIKNENIIYPTILNIKDIISCNLYSNCLQIDSIGGQRYRIKEPALLKILRGEVQELLVILYYGNFHLVLEIPKSYIARRKLKNGETICNECNGYGRVGKYIIHCNRCGGKGKLNWIQKVFAK